MRAKGFLTILITCCLALGALDAPAAVKSQFGNCTHAVRQGVTQISSTLGCDPLPEATDLLARRHTGAGERWNACEAAARARTPNPGNPIRTFIFKTGSGATIPGTAADREDCELGIWSRLSGDGSTRVSGSNVNSCQVVTRFSTATNAPICLSSTSYIFSYMAGVTCAPIPGPNPKPMTCPGGQLGAWAQTGTRGPAPTCAEIWTPAQPNPGDCFTLDRTARLSWTPPTRNSDGSSLSNLAGYDVHFGTTASAQTQTRRVPNAGLSSYIFTDLAPNPWYFSLTAYTSVGARSVPSNTVLKVVR